MWGSLYFLLHKVVDVDLGFKLSSKEFKCKCNRPTCNLTIMSPRLRESWNISRAQFGKPLKINSGFRCGPHNEASNGHPRSKHMTGDAIDISHKEFENIEKQRLRLILENNFDRVIEYPTFYHCQNN